MSRTQKILLYACIVIIVLIIVWFAYQEIRLQIVYRDNSTMDDVNKDIDHGGNLLVIDLSDSTDAQTIIDDAADGKYQIDSNNYSDDDLNDVSTQQ